MLTHNPANPIHTIRTQACLPIHKLFVTKIAHPPGLALLVDSSPLPSCALH